MKINQSTRTKLQSYETIEERLNFLKGMFKGDTAYLISCGPTLTQHDKEILNKKLKKKLVLCAKQSLNYFNDICDFHLVSTYNFQPYEYKNSNTIKSWQLTGMNMENELNRIVNEYKHEIDLYFPVISGPWITLEGSTAYTRNFDNWKMLGEKTQVMWGPGILYESGFPLCHLLGVNKIVTIGWDIGDLSKYENNERDDDWFNQHSVDLYENGSYTGKGPSYTELKNTIDCTSAMYDWFEKENIEVEILSDTNPADKRFKRINIEDL
tara:strand:+ start:3165 stop:3965 length:801 start_codon:yes stop_codon:yes gene_type:complete